MAGNTVACAISRTCCRFASSPIRRDRGGVERRVELDRGGAGAARLGDRPHQIGVRPNLAVPGRVAGTVAARRRDHARIGEELGTGEQRGVVDRRRADLAGQRRPGQIAGVAEIARDVVDHRDAALQHAPELLRPLRPRHARQMDVRVGEPRQREQTAAIDGEVGVRRSAADRRDASVLQQHVETGPRGTAVAVDDGDVANQQRRRRGRPAAQGRHRCGKQNGEHRSDRSHGVRHRQGVRHLTTP